MGQTVTPVSRQDSSIHGQTTHPGTSQTEPATQNGAGGRGYAFLVAERPHQNLARAKSGHAGSKS